MTRKEKSLAREIQELALRTGAPPEFIEKVSLAFLSRGVSLDEPSSPYRSALEETFQQGVDIRESTGRALDSVASVRRSAETIRLSLSKQLKQLHEIRRVLELAEQKSAAAFEKQDETRPRRLYGSLTATGLSGEPVPLVPGSTEPQ
jgi:hypothetical protein